MTYSKILFGVIMVTMVATGGVMVDRMLTEAQTHACAIPAGATVAAVEQTRKGFVVEAEGTACRAVTQRLDAGVGQPLRQELPGTEFRPMSEKDRGFLLEVLFAGVPLAGIGIALAKFSGLRRLPRAALLWLGALVGGTGIGAVAWGASLAEPSGWPFGVAAGLLIPLLDAAVLLPLLRENDRRRARPPLRRASLRRARCSSKCFLSSV